MKNQNIQTEVDASYLYGILAHHEETPDGAEIYRQMSEIEKSHALAFMAKHNISLEPFPTPSGRAKMLQFTGKVMRYDYILGLLMDTEKSLSNLIIRTRKKLKPESSFVSDTAHVTILKNLLDNQTKGIWID
jgi:hypothetical protein